jgi:hypothetical protein
VSAYPVNARQGKGTIGAGVAAIAAGFVVQAINIQSVASHPPLQLGSEPSYGNVAALSVIAGLLVLGGIVLAVIGVIRYAQSGPERVAAAGASPARTTARAPVSKPAFCSSCGAAIVGEGRFCASCGTPAAH